MARTKSIGIREELTSLVSTRRLNRLARETGLVQRQRKVKPMALFWTLVLGFALGGERSLAGLRRAYQKATGTRLVPSAFYDRFSESLVAFIRGVLAELIGRVGEREVRYQGILESFRDVLLTDSTVVRLHEMLEKRFPACRTNHTKASAKLHVVMSVKGEGPCSVKLTSGRVHDGPVLRAGRWVRDRLLLFDLGYFRYQLFDRIDRNGGFFVSRLKDNANPRITDTHINWRGRSIALVGEKLRDIVEGLKREVLDVQVEVVFRRRAYAGHRATAKRRFRLVGVKDTETGQYHFYVTNIPTERLSAEQIAAAYAGRWQIELLFMEMKSQYRLEDIPSRKAHIVEALLYITFITLIVSRRLLTVARSALNGSRRRIPEARWAKLFAAVASAILDLLLGPASQRPQRARWLERMLLHEAIDPNVSRQLLFDRVENASTWQRA